MRPADGGRPCGAPGWIRADGRRRGAHDRARAGERPLDDAMEMIADRIIEARASDWDEKNRRTLSLANLGGATLDNEENYLIKKLCMALGVVQVENQARI